MAIEIDWNAVAALLGPRLYNYFRRRGFIAQAADMTQETLLRLLEKAEFGEYNPNKGRLDQFAFGIARFVALEQRKRHPELMLDLESVAVADEEKIESDMQTQQYTTALRAAIGELTEAQQDVLWLILDEDLKLDEIALILEIPLGTVKSHVHRAKEQLKIKLSNVWESI